MLQPEHSGWQAHQSERFVQSALDALAAHICILDENGIIIGVNAAWCRFADDNQLNDDTYGLGTNYLAVCDQSVGRNSREASLVSIGIRSVMTGRQDEFYIEYPCHSKDEKRWFVMHVTRFDWNNKPRYILAHQNITELKLVQLELAESQKRIQAIVDNVVNGIMSIDADGVIESVNPAACNLFGYSSRELEGSNFTMLFTEPRRSTPLRLLLSALEGSTEHEMTGIKHDGSTFPMYFAINKMRLGNRLIYTAIIYDITLRKQMEAELLENEKLNLALDKERELRSLKNRFITMMSHELRTPLASILLSSDMLKRYGDLAPQEEKILYLDNISTQVEYLTELIKDVSTISRADAQTANFMPERTDMVTFVRQIVEEFMLTHRLTHCLDFDSTHAMLYTMADRKLMRQVLTNLISNAIKYSPDSDQPIVVQVHNGSMSVVIEVQDRGIGIPEDELAQIFEPFHRASNSGNFPGTGLGLAITRQAVELHNGTIEAVSTVGIGTTMIVRLPIVHDD